MQRQFGLRFLLAAACLVPMILAEVLRAADDSKAPGVDAKVLEQTVNKAIEHLRRTQAEDGSWNKATGPAVTALVTTGIIRSGRSVDDPLVAKALKYMEKFVQ